MQQLVSVFEAAPLDADDVTWDHVSRKPFTESVVKRSNYVIGLYDTAERIRELTGCEQRTVNVVAEFHVKMQEDDEPSSFLNHCLGNISRRIGQDIYLGGLAQNCRESGSELDIDGAFSKYVSGILVFDVIYRCRANDPYTRV
jgi:hypothetical protein